MSILSYNLKPATPYHPPPTTLPPPLHLAPDLGHSVLLERLMNHLRVALLFFTCNSTLHMYQRHIISAAARGTASYKMDTHWTESHLNKEFLL